MSDRPPPSTLPWEDALRLGPYSELFIVEGDSAARAVSASRNPESQGVLAMQGKPLNAWKASRSRIAQNPWYRTLTAALGAGWGTEFRVEALRYQRVLLLCDPDADGIHIAALLSLFFWKWMRPAIQEQRVGIIQAPVAEILAPGSTAPSWVHSEEELQQVWAHHAGRSPAGGPPDFAGGRSGGAPRIHRYRGLASLNSDVLRAHCLAPDTRRERRLTAQEIQLIAQIWCGDAES